MSLDEAYRALKEELGIQRVVNQNLSTRISELLSEADGLRKDLKLMATVDPETYKKALEEIEELKERIDVASDALKGNHD